MIIEYIGEVIRTEVSEIREKQYESKVSNGTTNILRLYD